MPHPGVFQSRHGRVGQGAYRPEHVREANLPDWVSVRDNALPIAEDEEFVAFFVGVGGNCENRGLRKPCGYNGSVVQTFTFCDPMTEDLDLVKRSSCTCWQASCRTTAPLNMPAINAWSLCRLVRCARSTCTIPPHPPNQLPHHPSA